MELYRNNPSMSSLQKYDSNSLAAVDCINHNCMKNVNPELLSSAFVQLTKTYLVKSEVA